MTRDTEAGRSNAGGPEAVDDGDAVVQEELRREAAERDALGGDTAMDRNLTGSSTWVTLGRASDAPAVGESEAADGIGRVDGDAGGPHATADVKQPRTCQRHGA